MSAVPRDFPVRPLRASTPAAMRAKDFVTCGTCGRSWDDAIATGYTPAPGGRCPFESFHVAPKRPACFATGGPNPFTGAPRGSSLIELRQQGRDRFSVRYGLQLKTGLSYADAAAELGACIMHSLACDGLLDNREPRT